MLGDKSCLHKSVLSYSVVCAIVIKYHEDTLLVEECSQ